MIIYGWNSKVLKHAQLEGETCTNCNQESTLITIIASYFHIFWIPMFPYRKKAVVHCGSCEVETKKKQMAPDFAEKIKQLKTSVSLPVWMFSGLAIVALLVVYILISK